MSKRRILLLSMVALLALFWFLGPDQAEMLRYLQTELAVLRLQYAMHPWVFTAAFFFLYALLTSFIPVGIPLMLLGGAIFPFWLGTLLVCTGYSVGATANFLIARYLLGDALSARWAPLQDAIARDGWFYLFALRLIPVIPAQGVSFAMGATKLSIPAFFMATWLGDLPLSALLVYTGRRFTEIESGEPVLSTGLIAGFTLFALVLIVGKWWLARRLPVTERG